MPEDEAEPAGKGPEPSPRADGEGGEEEAGRGGDPRGGEEGKGEEEGGRGEGGRWDEHLFLLEEI
ncbi:MAG: tRNA-splicing 2'-phosphotransferase [Methanothrix sp.]|nr:MAG: tRNA-splicing 2'-phosphotransferase [Methanothrix sp.]